MTYKANKTWRLKNPKKRNAERKRYYSQFPGTDGYKHWSIPDEDFILMSKASDRELHALLGRSVLAIQIKRCRLLKKW